eukprot:CAMPEP_0185271860 /NCGR_PEP_ID=MMETSP1359-20130426/45802_1 /TAXON_ID=552665 /ORGANISM="Bigelowiella longifila, Strain CCMP242" /LENGTH=302 /DNA_ID=CAMNT_0027863951 /DNA_START=27 /DNA_END=935 /DNA_ORIENTATION=-
MMMAGVLDGKRNLRIFATENQSSAATHGGGGEEGAGGKQRNTLATSSKDGTIRLWRQVRASCDDDWICVRKIAVGGGKPRAAGAFDQGVGGEAKASRNKTKRKRKRARRAAVTDWHQTPVCLQISDDARTIIAAVGNGIMVVDVERSFSLTVHQGHTDRVQAVSLSRAGSFVASASLDSSVRLWNLRFVLPDVEKELFLAVARLHVVVPVILDYVFAPRRERGKIRRSSKEGGGQPTSSDESSDGEDDDDSRSCESGGYHSSSSSSEEWDHEFTEAEIDRLRTMDLFKSLFLTHNDNANDDG